MKVIDNILGDLVFGKSYSDVHLNILTRKYNFQSIWLYLVVYQRISELQVLLMTPNQRWALKV